LVKRHWPLSSTATNVTETAWRTVLLAKVPAQKYGAALFGVCVFRNPVQPAHVLRPQRHKTAGKRPCLFFELVRRNNNANAFFVQSY
jgi:hypothetical protein